jgi:hypothetical protein
MGMDNQERVFGIYHAIDYIIEKSKELSKCNTVYSADISYLMKHVNKLWSCFIKKYSNPTFWILGSSAGNNIINNEDKIHSTPWEIAILEHCGGILKHNQEDKYVFDVFDNHLGIPDLLAHNNPVYKCIYQIYAMTEQCIYFLRRYDDEFLKYYSELNKIVCDIQGECYTIFNHNVEFAAAYILNQICKLIYGNYNPHNNKNHDSVTSFLVKEHVMHHISRPMRSHEMNVKMLAQMHDKLQKAKNKNQLSKFMRLEAVMQLCGRRFHHDVLFNELLNSLKSKDIKKDEIEKLKALFVECKQSHEEYEKQSHDDYKNNHDVLSIYE